MILKEATESIKSVSYAQAYKYGLLMAYVRISAHYYFSCVFDAEALSVAAAVAAVTVDHNVVLNQDSAVLYTFRVLRTGEYGDCADVSAGCAVNKRIASHGDVGT